MHLSFETLNILFACYWTILDSLSLGDLDIIIKEVMIGKCGGVVLNLFFSHELPTQYAVSYIVVTSQPDQRTILFVKKKKFLCLPYCCLKDFTGLHMKEKIKSVPLQPFFWSCVLCIDVRFESQDHLSPPPPVQCLF